jgi:hypothetical protein
MAIVTRECGSAVTREEQDNSAGVWRLCHGSKDEKAERAKKPESRSSEDAAPAAAIAASSDIVVGATIDVPGESAIQSRPENVCSL